MNACRSCGAPIRWITTVHGKPMPLDVEPAEGGTIRIESGGQRPTAVVLGPLELMVETGPLYVSHFATCPDADGFRKRDNG